MVILQGKSVFGGVAIGKIQFFKRDEIQIKRRHVDDPEAEIRRFRTAKEKALSELQQLYDKALTDVGEANAMIFEAHQLMLEDPDYNDSVENIINTQKVNAEYAIGVTSDNYAAIFEAMDDAYMQGRAADVKDVSNRLLSQFAKKQNASFEMTEQVIIAADDLAPSETVQLDKDKVLAFITVEGSANSHTAILARTMNIPILLQMFLNERFQVCCIFCLVFTFYFYQDLLTFFCSQTHNCHNSFCVYGSGSKCYGYCALTFCSSHNKL
jgi:phosphoenolpyruvate-protein phosphotransferase (PTS system enzyme I)